MAALDEQGLADDTLLIFTSDNGPECIPAAAGGCYEHARLFGHFSMAHLRGAKRDTWEAGHRVPFVARLPGVTPAGSVSGQLTLLGDFLATCAGLTGVRLPPGEAEDSISMLPLLQGRTDAPVRRSAVHHSCSGDFALREDDWVFIDAPSGDDNGEPDWFKEERGYRDHDFPGELFQPRGGHLRAAEPVRAAPRDRAPAVRPPRGHQGRGGGRGRSAGRGAGRVGVGRGTQRIRSGLATK